MAVPCVRVAPERGETVRQELAAAGVLDYEHEIETTPDWLYIPITDPTEVPAEYRVVDRDLADRDTQTMPADLLDVDPAYERLGDLVILHEDDPDRAETIAAAIMTSDIPAKTVVNRASPVQGAERVRDWTILAGNGTETIHREYGFEYAIDIADVYFSPRLATERHRVTQQAGPDEQAIDMFAGVGPYAIPLASRGAEVIATDINDAAIAYLEENARRNAVADRITAIHGDSRELTQEYSDWADRIVMNLPHSADAYLDTAIALASDDCTIHYYDIQHEDDPFEPGETAITTAAEQYTVTISTRRVVRSYAPHELNVCLDAHLTRERPDHNP